ncbi:MAG: glycosyltransferase, partial [Legionella sp.]
MLTMKKIGVVIPAYCESENIVDLCKEILSSYSNADIIVVDDSPDLKTIEALENYSNPKVKIIHREFKAGRGSAVLFGLSQLSDSDCEYFLELDADFSHPPKQIPSMVEYAVANNIDLLIASRYLKKSKILNWSLSRRVFSRCSNFLAKNLLRVPVTDYTNGFRLYSKRAASEINTTCGKLGSGFIALSEILVNLY